MKVFDDAYSSDLSDVAFFVVATSSALLPWLARIVWNRFLLLYWPARCLANQMKHGGIDEKVLALSSRNERVWSIFHQVDLVRPIGHTILVSLTARLEMSATMIKIRLRINMVPPPRT